MKTTKSIIVVLFVLLAAQIASAYYCPSTGRWLSRDPMGEQGFETLRVANALPQIGGIGSLPPTRWINRDPIAGQQAATPYDFVGNNPANLTDGLGLVIVNLKYETYIETPKLYFLGQIFNGGVKTRHSVNVDTDAETVYEVEKFVGHSIEYDQNGNIIKQGQANGSTIKVSIDFRGPSRGSGEHFFRVRMVGDESNPLVSPAPGITYAVYTTFFKCSHKMIWSGEHDQFPSHDFYEQGKLAHHFSHVAAGTNPFYLISPPWPDATFSGADTF